MPNINQQLAKLIILLNSFANVHLYYNYPNLPEIKQNLLTDAYLIISFT